MPFTFLSTGVAGTRAFPGSFWKRWTRKSPAPTVSIVMPSLDQGRYIEIAVISVLDQEVEGLELVVVDGGSTDNTLTRLADLAMRYPRACLRWVSAPDGGPAQAINRAVALSSAPIIGWLNSDDLYESGAIARALGHFARAPADVMVYGQAIHVDASGAGLGAYPTLGPEVGIAEFANGCFICQPSVFLRRSAWESAGGLDETLRAAFDFDLWMKLFKAYPGRIGLVAALQARSRLHEGGITLRLRERVALEGMTVLHRHLGEAPPEWLLTHFAELDAAHPFEPDLKNLVVERDRLISLAEPLLPAGAADALRAKAASDRRLLWSTPHLLVTVFPDGWAGPVLDVRLRQPAQPYGAIVLRCRHLHPARAVLRIRIVAPDGSTRLLRVWRGRPFEVRLELLDMRPGACSIHRIVSLDEFVPAEHEVGSTDTRRLAFLVEACELFPSALSTSLR